jgi:monoamine oxidase
MPVSRRTFLGVSIVAAAPAACRQSGGPSDPTVIVGAGLAGLHAADLLRRAGHPVVVLEARQRAGGRVFTLRSAFDEGLHAEAGPIRISSAHRSILKVIRAFRLPLVPFESSVGSSVMSVAGTVSRSSQAAGPSIVDAGLRPDERGLSPYKLLERYTADIPGNLADAATTAASYARWSDYDRLTWPNWLRSRGASPGAVKLMTLGGDSEHLSALYVLRQYALLRTSTQLYKIQGGMDLLPRAMAAALGNIVQYSAPVVRVTRTAARLRIDYESNAQVKSVAASHVIFAIPLPTLRQIEILPRLSQPKERAIEEAAYAVSSRVLLQCRSRFWADAGLNGSARTDRATETWDCTYDQRTNGRGILGATTGGAASQQMLAQGPDQSLALGVNLVAEAFPEVRSQIEKGVVHHWALEPWSRGSFVAFRPGQMTSFMPEMIRAEDRIHFAGEHTSSWMGWMEGALESGERAAQEILASRN